MSFWFCFIGAGDDGYDGMCTCIFRCIYLRVLRGSKLLRHHHQTMWLRNYARADNPGALLQKTRPKDRGDPG